MVSKKFFLFRRSDPVGPIKRFSENGTDISILGIPADQIAFMTAGQGQVNLTFNNASIYEDSGLFIGDSIEKTNISISCKEGAELSLIEKIILFASSATGKTMMMLLSQMSQTLKLRLNLSLQKGLLKKLVAGTLKLDFKTL